MRVMAWGISMSTNLMQLMRNLMDRLVLAATMDAVYESRFGFGELPVAIGLHSDGSLESH